MCMKCKEEKAVVVIRIHDPLCRSCFLTYVTHKFRSTIGKARLIKANDKVLLAISGGHSSTALLHLVKDALSLGAHKRLKFFPGIVCIDETEILPQDVNQDYSHLKTLSAEFEYPFYKVPIYQGYRTDSAWENDGKLLEKDRQEFTESFRSISTLTAQQEFITTRRISLITQTAKLYGYKKIMLGDSATTLCMKLLCNIALGRGATVPLDVGVSDMHFSDIIIIRPMRELTSKEVAIFNRLCQIVVLPPPNLNTMKNAGSSLQRQTEEFIIGLQANFPSTVNTVFRTGDKISMNEDLENSAERCALCQSPMLNSSTVESEGTCEENGCCGNSDDCMGKNLRLTMDDMKSQLCYACNLTFKDMAYQLDALPQETLDYAASAIKRGKMRESIQEFLLE